MMKLGRNIVFYNFSDKEQKWITINDIRKEKELWESTSNENHRFPYIKYVDSFYELFRSHGFMAVIKAKDIGYNIKEFDLKYHERLKNYNYIAIVDESYKDSIKFDKYSKIGLLNYDLFTLEYSALELDNFYKKHLDKIKINIKPEYEKKIIKCLKIKEMNSKELSKEISVSIRTVERYMKTLSDKEYAIRYNKSNKYWYLLK